MPPEYAKKPMPFCKNVAEVISFESGLGFPRENFIPDDVIILIFGKKSIADGEFD